MEDRDPHTRILAVALDSNALDLNGSDRDGLVERFRGLMRTGTIAVMVPHGVEHELRHPNTPRAVRDSVPPRPSATGRRTQTASEQIARIRVRAILRGDADTDKHAADAAHLCDAAEAGCRYFLTQDRRFSRKRRDLEAALPAIEVLGLREFFERHDDLAELDPDEP